MKKAMNTLVMKLCFAGKQLIQGKQGDNIIVTFLVGALVTAICGVLLFKGVEMFFPTFMQDVFAKISRDLLS